MTLSTDVVVIGAGAIGASTALHLAQLGVRVTVVEKEAAPALHQSGRNSGVIHAGYNLKPGSQKARYCVEGNRRLREYCLENHIPMKNDGILIVARTDPERAVLAELDRRARANGVQARLVDETEIREIEPHVVGIQALHAPEGASFDSQAFVRRLIADARALGVETLFGTPIVELVDPAADGRSDDLLLRTPTDTLRAAVVVNAAGLQADRVAGAIAKDIRMIPFRGYYAELRTDRADLVRSHVYSAPDLTFPFLGVHASRRTDGGVLLGPGAMLAFGREAYRFREVNPRDLAETLAWPGFYRMISQPRVLRLISSEIRKSLSLAAIAAEARLLIPELRARDLTRSFAGNRAQLVSRTGQLVDDILVRETEHAVHVLNAVSPGLTCSLPFGANLAQRCLAKLNGETTR